MMPAPTPLPTHLTPESVRRRLRALIDDSGRTASAVAAEAGMGPEQLSQILRGYRANPSVDVVGRVLGALGASWADLDQTPRVAAK